MSSSVKFATSNLVFITVLSARRRCPRLVLWFYVRRHLLSASITRQGNGNSVHRGWIAREEWKRDEIACGTNLFDKLMESNWRLFHRPFRRVSLLLACSIWRACAACNFPETPRYIFDPGCERVHVHRMHLFDYAVLSKIGTDRRWKIFSHRWKPLGWSFPRHSASGWNWTWISRSYFFLTR